MADTPVRIRLSRARGWRMPRDTVKVDRSTPWGNPFVVGRDGTAAECVRLYRALLGGLVCVSRDAVPQDQRDAEHHARAHISEIRGKNLACWCALDKPCHADVLLEVANTPESGEARP
ncbi:DUF4326 domain-containing protein [Ancylobacter sp. MQZ15Z-1]|uniref:DUF4326 domain-containing protein n=1 Tax=Ancylobacter mangrovi TaxID=2972472 RepID=A0A9X2PMJ7_9HYPH|nr:DUF4326 domain-containing protein [Ancylobacter mangrovi]MCS0497912.1 DUF4326 domain-containing protein [Ancylobacter mangrovi]